MLKKKKLNNRDSCVTETKKIHSKNKKVQNDLPYSIYAYHTYFVLYKQTQTRTNEIFLCF